MIIYYENKCVGGRQHSSSGLFCKWCGSKKRWGNKSNDDFTLKANEPILLERVKHRNYVLKILALKHGWVCWYCGNDIKFNVKHIDHIQPKSKGGGNDLDNFALSCGFCNRAKAARSVEEFIEWLIGLSNSNVPHHNFDAHLTNDSIARTSDS